MSKPSDRIEVRVLDRLTDIDAASWDRLCGDCDAGEANNPFIEHAFLASLEASGSVGSRHTGWVPRHLCAYTSDGDLVGAMPLYEKYDSYGEYIFDWGWARAARHAGIPYYPKLVAAVPFTPVTGRRLLIAPGLRFVQPVVTSLVEAAREVADRCGASSMHLLFVTRDEQEMLVGHDFLPRSSYQFHWENTAGWSCFDDYLGAMRSRARKQIRRERRQAAEHGLTLSVRRGVDLGEREWQALWQFYQITASHKWGNAYLTRDFFHTLRERLAHRVVASFAHQGCEPVAGALMFHKGNHLYGRYWGARLPLRAMHFELCYYQPIAWCLDNGITRFEAGAQGEHKLKRGLMPSHCHSAHWIRDPALAAAIERFLPEEAAAVSYEVDLLGEHGPFRQAQR